MSTSASIQGPIQAPDEVMIMDITYGARQLFDCCDEIKDEHVKLLTQVQLDRFNLWASNIGVFAHRSASLDYRLRAAPAAKVAVEAELETLCERLLTGTTYAKFSAYNLCANIDSQF